MTVTKAKTILAGLVLMCLAACDTPTPHIGVAQRLSAPYVEAQHQFRFASGASSLSAQERARIAGFLNQLALKNGDFLIVTIPSSGQPKIDAERQAVLQSLLARSAAKKQYLMDTSFGSRPSYRQTGVIRATRTQGLRVDCKPSITDLGCASAVNLAAMIHEPGDVLEPDMTATMARRDAPLEGHPQ